MLCKGWPQDPGGGCERSHGGRGRWSRGGDRGCPGQRFLARSFQIKVAREEIKVGFEITRGPDVDFLSDDQLGEVRGSGQFAVGLQDARSERNLILGPLAVVPQRSSDGLLPEEGVSSLPNGLWIDGKAAFVDFGVQGSPGLRVTAPE